MRIFDFIHVTSNEVLFVLIIRLHRCKFREELLAYIIEQTRVNNLFLDTCSTKNYPKLNQGDRKYEYTRQNSCNYFERYFNVKLFGQKSMGKIPAEIEQ